MNFFIKPVTRPGAAIVLRALLYFAILGGVWVVSNLTAAAAPPFIYQGF